MTQQSSRLGPVWTVFSTLTVGVASMTCTAQESPSVEELEKRLEAMERDAAAARRAEQARAEATRIADEAVRAESARQEATAREAQATRIAEEIRRAEELRRKAPMENLGAGVLRDPWTGLKWTRSDHDTRSRDDWSAARAYCAQMGGSWRLPSADELIALYNNERGETNDCPPRGGCNVSPYFRLSSSSYWSSEDGWYVSLKTGEKIPEEGRCGANKGVLCVNDST